MKNLLFILILLIGFCSCQKEPSEIYITKITVKAINYSDANGNPWETNGTTPDLYVKINGVSGGATEYTPVQNNVNFTYPPYWDLNFRTPIGTLYSIELYEAGGTSRKMIEFPFKYNDGDGSPSTITLSDKGYYLDVEFRYVF